MLPSLRQTLLICAALFASSVAPAQAGPSDESLPAVEVASLPKVDVPNLLDDGIEPQLSQPETPAQAVEPATGEQVTATPANRPRGELSDMVAQLRTSDA